MKKSHGPRAIVLFGHGARDPEWARPLCRVLERMKAQAPEELIACGYLEYLTPTLEDCVAGLIAQGAREIVVLPMFIAQGGHLKRELPEMVARLERAYPDVLFQLESAVGESALVIEAMATHAASFISSRR